MDDGRLVCLVIQPIHDAGLALLRAARIEVRNATASDPATVANEIVDATAAITRNAGLSRAAMLSAPDLRVLGVHGTGYDPVDLECADEVGLPVVYTPEANVQSVAEHTISQMMAVAKRIREADAAVRRGDFDFRYRDDFCELGGKTLGIVGFGRTGRRTAEIARHGFGMRILVYSHSAEPGAISASGFEVAASLEELVAHADIVSLHLRLTIQTRHLANAALFARMKSGAIFVNAARGGLVDQDALIAAVAGGHLAGAALDVFEGEPIPADHPLTKVDRIVLSPHIAGATREAMERTAIEVASEVLAVLEGRSPRCLANPGVWERRRGRPPAR
jgi:D-3-phosphoglycerate dehydrogenase / 2-oxoglutarate reductase